MNEVNKDSLKTCIRYNDTDSAYMEVTDIMDHYNIPFFDEDGKNVNSKLIKVCKVLEDNLNKRIYEWGNTTLNSKDCRLKFKMEAISDKAFFIKKKKYILHVINDEGYLKEGEDCWKYKGVSMVSAGMSEAVKPLVSKIVQRMIMLNDKGKSDQVYYDTYDEFCKLGVDDLAQIKSANVYNKYADQCDDWTTAKGMLAHYRGAYYYNKLIKDLGISHIYSEIKQSDKIKYIYVNKNNRYGIDVISYVDNYPLEFEDIFEINLPLMFEKGVKNVVNQFYTALDWVLTTPNKQAKINVMSEFLIN